MDVICREPARSEAWYRTPAGDARGYIEPHTLRELWFMTGTACNLECPFCFEGSKPADDRLGLVKLKDVEPFIYEAVELGVEQFSFTGGEPFVARDMVKILQLASRYKPCLVLTNGTEPVLKRLKQLESLQESHYPVSFRISIDWPDQEKHDAGRGEGSFHQAMQGIRELHRLGFHVSVARQMAQGEDAPVVEKAYRELFATYHIPEDMRLVAFPDFHLPGSHVSTPQITEDCMTRYHTAATREHFMCSFSKMVVKSEGRMRVYACTLVDDDPEYDLGGTLKESMEPRVSMKHHRCYSCFSLGSSCSEIG